MFADGTHTPPLPLPRLEQTDQSYSQGLHILFSVLGALLMLMAIGFGVWTWRNRQSYVIKASQPEFLLIICAGVFFMAFSLILRDSSHPPQSYAFADFSCMGSYWFFFSGFGLAFSALFSKTWRIVKILGKDVRRFHRVVVAPREVISPLLVCVAGNVLIVAVWQAVDPLQFERVDYVHGPLDRFGRYTESIGQCSSEKGSDSLFLGALLILNGCMIIAANVMVYRARHITMEFSESSYIAIAMAIILQVLVLSLPIFIYETSLTVSRVGTQVLVLVVASSILSLVFIPKIGANIRHEKLQRAREQTRKSRRSNSRHSRREFSGSRGRLWRSGDLNSRSDEFDDTSDVNAVWRSHFSDGAFATTASEGMVAASARIASSEHVLDGLDRKALVASGQNGNIASGQNGNSEPGLDGSDRIAPCVGVSLPVDAEFPTTAANSVDDATTAHH